MTVRHKAKRWASSAIAVAIALAATGMACAGGSDREDGRTTAGPSEPDTRLNARPVASARGACAPGRYELRIAPGRRALLQVTPGARSGRRALLLALHGAGSGGAPGGLWAFKGAWSVRGLVIVAPSAAGSGWSLDASDVGFVDRALRRAFERCAVDPRRIAAGGFSSGAGMALWLGLTNGDLFRWVLSFSPGSSLPSARIGKPRVYLAHGIQDGIIPIGVGGDAVARELRGDGYRVTYRRFRGGHQVLPELTREAVRRALGRGGS